MIHIRPATESDTTALAAVFLAARVQGFAWMDPAGFRLEDFALQTAGEIIHLAEDGSGTLLGFISVWEADRFVHHLFIAPDQQGKGVGSRLLASLDAWLPRPHRLKCMEQNTAALAFYHKHGWRVTGRGNDAGGPYRVMENSAGISPPGPR